MLSSRHRKILGDKAGPIWGFF